ncbi:1-pyrroline-5-carboxylate dehydrogenase, partial [Microbacterium keratanolyticum]
LIGLGSWKATSGGAPSSTLHLRGLDTRITALIEAAQPSLDFDGFEWLRRAALADAVAWDREFGRVRDVSRLGVERNLFRYRPVPVAVRATGDAPWRELLRVTIAAIRAGSDFTLSTPVGLPAAVRRVLGELRVPVSVETDDEWVERMRRRGDAVGIDADATGDSVVAVPAARTRIIGGAAAVAALHRALAEAVEGDPDLAVYDGEVTTAGRIELLPFVREQSIAITAHRFGHPDAWSEDVI